MWSTITTWARRLSRQLWSRKNQREACGADASQTYAPYTSPNAKPGHEPAVSEIVNESRPVIVTGESVCIQNQQPHGSDEKGLASNNTGIKRHYDGQGKEPPQSKRVRLFEPQKNLPPKPHNGGLVSNPSVSGKGLKPRQGGRSRVREPVQSEHNADDGGKTPPGHEPKHGQKRTISSDLEDPSPSKRGKWGPGFLHGKQGYLGRPKEGVKRRQSDIIGGSLQKKPRLVNAQFPDGLHRIRSARVDYGL